MSAVTRSTGHVVATCSRAALAVAFLTCVCETRALAQATDDRGGFVVREVSLSSGYASLQLPPVTLGGQLPNDILHEDLVTTGAAEMAWRRVTPRTRFGFELFGTYTARTRHSQLNAPGTDLAFGVSRAFSDRWRLGAGVANAIVSSGQLSFQPPRTGRLVEDAASLDDLAGRAALARSPSPDPTQAALFLPISQSLDDLYGQRIMASTARAEAAYQNSVRFETHFRGSYTDVRRISARPNAEHVPSFADSTAAGAGVGVSYRRSERTRVTAALDWSQASGQFVDRTLIASAGYGWAGKKWFTGVTLGTAVRRFPAPLDAEDATKAGSWTPTITYGAAIGYRFPTQTLLAQYSRSPHDEYGRGGRNVLTGFEGDVQSVAGAWSWSGPRGRWMAQADFSMIRRPGNFSYIYAWLSTASIGRRFGPHVRLMGQLLFDRHGSRAFEGFHMTRGGARLNLVWTPQRQVRPGDSVNESK